MTEHVRVRLHWAEGARIHADHSLLKQFERNIDQPAAFERGREAKCRITAAKPYFFAYFDAEVESLETGRVLEKRSYAAGKDGW